MSFTTFHLTLNELNQLLGATKPVTLGSDIWDAAKLQRLKEIMEGCVEDDTVMSIQHRDAYQYEEDSQLISCPTGWYVYYNEYEEEGFIDYIPDDDSLSTTANLNLLMGGEYD